MQHTSRSVYEFISHQTSDPIVEWKICAISGTEFPIYQSDIEFYNKISPTFAGQKFQIPTPTLCPEERSRRRLSFRNERKLYKRKCDFSGKDIISIYSPDKGCPVYTNSVWWSDVRDPMDYGFEFDFNRNFIDQFRRLMMSVPMPARTIEEKTAFNSDYCNEAGNIKDCYLCYEMGLCEGCLFCRGLVSCDFCIDCLNCNACQQSYELTECNNCSMCFSSDHCSDGRYLYHCSRCIGCSYCINCVGLSNQQYCINNQQVSKEQFELTLSQSLLGSTSDLYLLSVTHNIEADNCIGEYLLRCNDVILSYTCTDLDHCRYCDFLLGGYINSNSYDISNFGMGLDYCYESQCIGGNPGASYHTLFSNQCRPADRNLYCHYCISCSHCFGCVGLRNKQYCIFNKQYENKEEYEIQVAKIIAHMMSTGEWGEFFHPSLSPFGYNETVAQEYYPLHAVGASLASPDNGQGKPSPYVNFADYGYKRSTYSSDPKIPDTAQVLRPGEMSDNDWDKLIESDDIVRQVLICEVSGRPYMIQKAELEFYRKHNLPIPRKHPDVRHEERMKLRPGRTLYLRTCDCCEKEMLSVCSEEHEGKVYCEQCYQKEIFG